MSSIVRTPRLGSVTLGGQSITREKLYEMVWTDAVTVVAARYDISDVALRKLCKRRNIPVPTVGYWAHIRRKEKGSRSFRKPPLPALV